MSNTGCKSTARTNIGVGAAVYRRLRICAAIEGRKVKDVAEDAINAYLSRQKHGKDVSQESSRRPRPADQVAGGGD